MLLFLLKNFKVEHVELLWSQWVVVQMEPLQTSSIWCPCDLLNQSWPERRSPVPAVS